VIVEAVVIRANGTREDLGTIADSEKNTVSLGEKIKRLLKN
jgi:hypothetical protein